MVYLQGFIKPVVEGANIRAVHKSEPEIVLETKIDASGQYRLPYKQILL